MLEHTKKRRIRIGTAVYKRTKSRKIVKENLDDSVMSYEDAMGQLLNGLPQGSIALKGFRNREGLTQEALGSLLGLEQTNISKMERGERQIGKSLAKKLATFFKTDYRLFL